MELQMFSLFANRRFEYQEHPRHSTQSVILPCARERHKKNSTWTQRKKEEKKFSFRKFHSGCGGCFICHRRRQTLNCFSPPRAKFTHFSLCERILNFFLCIIFSESAKIESVLSNWEKRANSNDPMKIPFGCDFMAQLTANSRWGEEAVKKVWREMDFDHWKLLCDLIRACYQINYILSSQFKSSTQSRLSRVDTDPAPSLIYYLSAQELAIHTQPNKKRKKSRARATLL